MGAIKGVWPKDGGAVHADARADFIKHFYFEVWRELENESSGTSKFVHSYVCEGKHP